MKRLLFTLMLFLYASFAYAQSDKGGPHGSSLEDIIWSESLDVLLETPLPGEPQTVLGIDQQRMDSLLGRRIVSIEAISPPAGFAPVDDLDVKPGSVLTRSLARQMVLNLWESGKYREVKVSGVARGEKEVVVYLRVEPMFRTARLVLTGNRALADAEVKRAIGFLPGGTVVPSSESMIQLRDKLVAEYGNRGYNNATASVRLETTENVAELALIIDINEGEPDKYVDVLIFGLTDDLSKEQLLRAAGLKKGIIRDSASVAEGLEKLQRTLFDLGYPDAKIQDEYYEKKLEEYRYTLSINVDVGLKTLLEFSGNKRLRARELREFVWKPGFRSDGRNLEKTASELKRYAVSRGLFHARVYVFRKCYADEDKWYTVKVNQRCARPEVTYQAVLFELSEGPQVQVEDIVIDGARKFSLSELQDEVFAFMAEQNTDDSTFESFSTESANRVISTDYDNKAAAPYDGSKTLFDKPETIYNPQKYLEVTRHLEDLYAEQGYLNAKVTDTCVISDKKPISRGGRMYYPVPYQRNADSANLLTPCLYIDRSLSALVVEFSIDEGVQTLIQNVEVDGNTPSVFTRAELFDIGGLKIRQPFNEYYIRDAANAIQSAYQEKGYMFVNVTWETTISMDQTAADVQLRVVEGPQVRVKNILINAETTNKWFIRNNLGFEEGNLVTPSVLNEARQRVMDIGVFNAATVQMQSPGVASDEKNIVVTVVERKSQYLELRAGAATEDGVRGGFEYGHRNIFGLAINYRLKIRANYRHEDIWFFGDEAQEFKDDLIARYEYYNANHDSTLAPTFKWFEWYFLTGFRTTNIPGTAGLLGTGIDITFENVNRRGYSALKVAPKYRLTSHYLRYLPVELSTGVDGTIVLPAQVSNEDDIRRSSFGRLPSGRAVFWVTGLSVGLDFRDNPLDPRKGVFLHLRGDYVHSLDKYTEQQEEGVMQRSRYIRFSGTLSGYIPFAGKGNVLALSTSVGYIFHLIENSITWADRRFYMGGVSTLRGFKSDTLFPEDVQPTYDDKGDVQPDYGGQAMILARMELRHDFGKNIVGVLFGEAGNLWRDEKNFLRKTESGDFTPFLLRPVAGVGLHYNTPVGPLAFDVGVNLKRKREFDEPLWAWYFSIGSAF
ncbi:MAG: BamA/TamA family outer membrane protein [Deltaproteobacteria bacterium]|nr:BamA/TamA family outer membrane protein [Deltaproteobacteria bacterium]MBN2672446.1 BamA/TamA family outer membrane protein [Deltaproteobacteria bacterium]